MMNIILIAGSNRRDATSTMLSRAVGQRMEAAGHQAAWFDLYEHPLPLYDPDADYTQDPQVSALSAGVMAADAIVLSSPEYHGTMSGVLKNALDHLGFEHFDGKAVLALSSAGGAVGVSTLSHIQTVVRNLHGINCPEWISIGGDQRRFAPDGTLLDPKAKARMEKVTDYFLKLAEQLRK